jgi:hypothetical protein
MKTLPLYLQRPKIYFTIASGWSTDRLFDQKNKNQKTPKN